MGMLAVFMFTGCGSVDPSMPQSSVHVKKKALTIKTKGQTIFSSVAGSETLFKASHKLKGKHRAVAKIVVPTINDINKEVLRRGYRYYQIVSPTQINNLEGFPINNKNDLAAFLNPQTSMPRHELSMLETGATLMDNQKSQSVVSVPFLIFGTTEFNLVVRLVKEPRVEEIVWDAKN